MITRFSLFHSKSHPPPPVQACSPAMRFSSFPPPFLWPLGGKSSLLFWWEKICVFETKLTCASQGSHYRRGKGTGITGTQRNGSRNRSQNHSWELWERTPNWSHWDYVNRRAFLERFRLKSRWRVTSDGGGAAKLLSLQMSTWVVGQIFGLNLNVYLVRLVDVICHSFFKLHSSESEFFNGLIRESID